MPRVARYKIAAIADLLRQLEYAPAEARLRQMDAAEQLIADLDPNQNYPQDFIIFRLTGYRSDQSDEPITFVGQALVPDLVNLVQTLSEKLEIPPEYSGRRAIAIDQLPARLNVSHKTVQRYRKQGLVCHYIDFRGTKKLACFEDSLARFIAGHERKLHRAAEFTRVNGELEASIIEEARQLRRSDRLSLNEAALRLADKHDRAHETIRLMLRRHDRRAAEPIFTERGPLTEREIRLIHRAWRWGIEPAQLAERFGKTKPTIHRAINRRRAELLRSIDLQYIKLPTFDLPDAATVILSAPAAVSDLNQPQPVDALALIRASREAGDMPDDIEASLLAAYNMLKMRSSKAIDAMGDDPGIIPGAEELDAIETDLRWAATLERKLVMHGLSAAIGSIEQNLHRPLKDETAEQIVLLLRLAADVVANAVKTIDPWHGTARGRSKKEAQDRGQRLERVAGFAMDRALAQRTPPRSPPRAAARHQAGSIAIPNLFDALNTWDAWLNVRRDVMNVLPRLDEKIQRAVTMRYGLYGAAPVTVAELARRLDIKPVGAARLLQRAAREMRAAAFR